MPWCLLVLVLVSTAPLRAAPTQDDIFKSIQQNVGESPTDLSKFLPFLLAAVAVVLLLALFSQRRKREIKPKVFNNQGKLIKEVMKTVPLRAAELKQLRLLVADAQPPVQSPLTLLLCPSVLADALKNRQARGGRAARLDKKVVLHLARKVGLQAK